MALISRSVLTSRQGPAERQTKVLTRRNNEPEGIHEDEVEPEVVGLRAIEPLPGIQVIEQTGQVVERIAVELARGHEGLNRMAVRGVSDDEHGREEGERSPGDLVGE